MSASTSTATRSSMNKYGLLINYDYCDGCHACEVACKKEHDLPKGQFGIKVDEYGPTRTVAGSWDYTFVPFLTNTCDLCADRTAMGKLPTCAHHCPCQVIEYGEIAELLEKQAAIGSRCALYTIGK